MNSKNGSVFDDRIPIDVEHFLRASRQRVEGYGERVGVLAEQQSRRQEEWYQRLTAEIRSELELDDDIDPADLTDELVAEHVTAQHYRGFERRDLEEHTDELVELENERRQLDYHKFRIASVYVAREFKEMANVERLVLYGRLATPLSLQKENREPFRYARQLAYPITNHIDLAVWLTEFDDLKSLQKARVRAVQKLLQETGNGVAHHQVCIALFAVGSDEYHGHLCNFKECPACKPDCDVMDCGLHPFAQRFPRFEWRMEEFAADRSLLLLKR